MPRPKDNEVHVTAAVGRLIGAVASLLRNVGVAIVSNPEVKGATRKVGRAAGVVGHAAAAKGAKLAKSIKASWARYTLKERAARIRKMLAARGLKPKSKKASSAQGGRRRPRSAAKKKAAK